MQFRYSIIVLLMFLSCSGDQSKTKKGKQRELPTPKINLPEELHGIKTMRLVPGGTSNLNIPEIGETQPFELEPFYMDETPVTYSDFEQYVSEGGLPTAYWKYESYNKPNQPVTGITWHQAADYCNWRSKKEGLSPAYYYTEVGEDATDNYREPLQFNDRANGYRLPTELEFEAAARGGLKNQHYPWGNHFHDSLANYDTGKGFKSSDWWRLADVKSQYKNGYGLYNMSGNNWHWCNNWYNEKVKRTKALRGGSWGSIDSSHLVVNNRSHSSPANYNYEIGFRCVRPVTGITAATKTLKTIESVEHEFYAPPKFTDADTIQPQVNYCSQAFTNQLAQYIGDNYPECVYFQTKIDEQEMLNPTSMAELIVDVCCQNKINPLFLTAIMISESGFGSCSFPRWYNSPMAYHWQNKLMANGLPVYESLPRKKNRKYKTLRIGFNAFCRGINWSPYYKAAHTDLYAFHRVYVGYEAKEWMHTLTRVFRDVAGIRFEPHYPEKNCGELIYLNWDELK